MGRPPTGAITPETLVNGTLVFRLRFHAYGARQTVYVHEARDCDCGCGGDWNKRTAAVELENILARVKAGVWEPPQRRSVVAKPVDVRVPSFHAYSSRWLQARIDGVTGEKPISARTQSDYRWRIQGHLLPFFTKYRLDEVDRDLCLAFKAYKLKEARDLREAIDAGADLRNKQGQRIVPLSAFSIRRLIDMLAAILEDAVEDRYIEHNPARGKRMRIHVPKPRRTFLEIDELVALVEAADKQDQELGQLGSPAELGVTAALVARLSAQGKRPSQIATELKLAKSTVTYHLGRLGVQVGRAYIGRRAVVQILGYGGPRASELCDIKIGHVRLHDPKGARFQIPDAKTESGIREVQMSPDLVEAVLEHLDRLRRIGAPTGPEDYLVPNRRGGRMDRQRVGDIVREAAEAANVKLVAQGRPPLPRTTPHTLRRTYVSIQLLANEFDVKWVMSQVGHADSKMTMDVYAQLEQRVDRSHGKNFDRLVREARKEASRALKRPVQEEFRTANGTATQKTPSLPRIRGPRKATRKRGISRQNAGKPERGFEPLTPCLQDRCSGHLSYSGASGRE
jgi:integrase